MQKKNTRERIFTVREGVTYEPKELNCSVGAQEEIPKFLEFDKCCGLVVFDHEITRLGRKSDITQFAACGGVDSFENYVIPRCNITSEASSSRGTGLTYCRESNSLYSHGKALYGELVQNEPLNLLAFLQSKKNPVLIGHNIQKFDLHVLLDRLNFFWTFCKTCSRGIQCLM